MPNTSVNCFVNVQAEGTTTNSIAANKTAHMLPHSADGKQDSIPYDIISVTSSDFMNYDSYVLGSGQPL